MRAKLREKRQVSARARRYYDEYELRMRARMLKRRTREEQVTKTEYIMLDWLCHIFGYHKVGDKLGLSEISTACTVLQSCRAMIICGFVIGILFCFVSCLLVGWLVGFGKLCILVIFVQTFEQCTYHLKCP